MDNSLYNLDDSLNVLLAESKHVAIFSAIRDNFYSRIVQLDIMKVLLPTDAKDNCFEWSIKIYIKTTPTCFGVITIIRERTI
jgi:hypothetical protein